MSQYKDTLDRFGFTKDPFGYRFGESMPDELLEETWVQFPDADRVLDLEQSTALLAPPGSGKTAWRRYFRKRIAAQFGGKEKPLVVVYNQFDLPVSSSRTLNDHHTPLLRRIARSVLNYLMQNSSSPALTAGESNSLDCWYAFLTYYLPPYYQDTVQELLYPSGGTQFFKKPLWKKVDALQEVLLDDLLPILPVIGINRLYILVDDLDGLLETQNQEALTSLVKPLVNTKLLLSDNRLVWKFFLPDKLERVIQQSSGYMTSRLEMFSIRWDENSLSKLLKLRLLYASEGKNSDIDMFFHEDVLDKGLPSIAICRIALMRLGSPHGLLQLCQQLFNNVSDVLITKDEWNEFVTQTSSVNRTSAGEFLMPKQIDLPKLKEILLARFDLPELKEICFVLGIGYDDLDGGTRLEKVMSLLQYLKRRDRLLHLIEYGQNNRPEIDWASVLEQTEILEGSTDSLPVPQQLSESKSASVIEPDYLDFDLHVAPNGWVIARSFEGERTAQISLEISNSIKLSLALTEKNQQGEFLRTLGRSLFEILFPKALDKHFNQSEAVARNQNVKIRIRLIIEADSLARIPWELMYREEGGYFLATNPKTVLSRYLNLPFPPHLARKQREGPLHLLVIISDPTDQVRLDPDEWETMIKGALEEPCEKEMLTVQTVKHATHKEISQALLQQPPDIVQFVGHGVYRQGKGYLALVDEETRKSWIIDDERFAGLFMGHDDNIRLLSLATCESAKSDSPQGFLGIAPKIVQRGVPSVVAMQYPVLIKSAKIFLEHFYMAVAEYKPIDWAVQYGRNAVGIQMGYDNREFATPVLYMRAKDGKVF